MTKTLGVAAGYALVFVSAVLWQGMAFGQGTTLTAGTYATIGSPNMAPDPAWSCVWPWDAPGPRDFIADAVFACNDPKAHPENMPYGTAFTYDALTGTGGDFVTLFNGQCYIDITPLLTGLIPLPEVAPPWLQGSQVSALLYYAIGAMEPVIGCLTGSYQGIPVTICEPSWQPTTWHMSQCENNPATLQCPSNTVADGGTCVCPAGTSWIATDQSCEGGGCVWNYDYPCGECSGTVQCGGSCSDTSGAGDPCGSCGALDCDGSCNDPCADGGDGGDGGEGGSYCDTYPDDPDCSMDCWSDDDCDGGYCKRDGFCDWDLADPVIVDLDGGGFDLTSAQNGVKFDFFGTGKPLQISWTAPASTNAWLVLDLNGDGRIDNGLEMFGNATRQPGKPAARLGFNALAFYDLPANGGNRDGVIDAQDRIFSRLRLWVDKNHNGISEPGELLTMEQAGVQSISLKYQSQKWTDAYGNRFQNRAKVVWAGHGQGQDHWAYDVVLMTPK